MALNDDTPTQKPKKKLFARWRRKQLDADQETVHQEREANSADQITAVETAGPLRYEERAIQNPDAPTGDASNIEVTRPKEPATILDDSEQLQASEATAPDNIAPDTPKLDTPNRPNVFSRALSKTGRGLETLFLGRRQIDEQMFEDLETQLLMADVGIEVCSEIIDVLTDRVKRKELNDSDALRTALHQVMVEILKPCEQALDVTGRQPFVILVVGVNGVGKTTTIGKLARQFQNQGATVMLAAGDTFRAAAVEQLQVWGQRNNVAVVAQHTGADSASVIYDALESANARHIDVLIADTAGRLHTKSNLMDELAKVKRVMAKLDDHAPQEILLVLDAGTGQNAIKQVQEFNDAVNVTGLAITKLDGTAKGGVVLALSRRFGIPVRYVGLGEGLDDLQVFDAKAYVDALLAEPLLTESQSQI